MPFRLMTRAAASEYIFLPSSVQGSVLVHFAGDIRCRAEFCCLECTYRSTLGVALRARIVSDSC